MHSVKIQYIHKFFLQKNDFKLGLILKMNEKWWHQKSLSSKSKVLHLKKKNYQTELPSPVVDFWTIFFF